MPAITPIYANNPAFRYVYFEPKQWILTDYTQYWADLVKGNGMLFLEDVCVCVSARARARARVCVCVSEKDER